MMSDQPLTPRQIYSQLIHPFNPNELHWRIGSTNKNAEARRTNNKNALPTKGQALAYVDARNVMKRLDDVLGFENWQDEYEDAKGRVICKLSIRVNGEWITKCDGAGDSNMEGEKGGISDAFKRAAVKFGVGRSLYYLEPVWVDMQNGYPPKNLIQVCNNTLPPWYLKFFKKENAA